MKLIRFMFLSSFVLVVSGCSIKPPTTYDFDQSFDFSKLVTYRWIESSDAKRVTTIAGKRQMNAIETQLNRKGFHKAASADQANFLLKTHTVTDNQTNIDTFYRSWGYYPGPYAWGWPYNSNTIVREYKIGTLVLDIVDPANKQVIWRGSVSRKLGIYKNRTPEERATIALANAEHLLRQFPPQSLSD